MNNQIRFPNDTIDFINDVGLTGQDHDSYAEPGTVSRYDWMQMIVLGLLAQQASNKKPENFRVGTLWFNLQKFAYECSDDNDFFNISEFIKVISTNLQEWTLDIDEKIEKYMPTGTFSGTVANDTSVINIPNQLQKISISPNKPYVFKNGLLINPSFVRFNNGCPVAIELLENARLTTQDSFVVFIK